MRYIQDDCFYREKQIILTTSGFSPIGRDPIIPVSHTAWWKGIKDGVYPKGRKLSPGITVWLGRDLREYVESIVADPVEARAS